MSKLSSIKMPHSIKGNKVYIVLYNYGEQDYSVIKIIENITDAYNYICDQESQICLNNISLVYINSTKDFINIDIDMSTDCLKILCILDENYYNYNICDTPNISSYIIVPMNIC